MPNPPNPPLILTPLIGMPDVKPGSRVDELLEMALSRSNLELQDEDVLVLAQKIVSKAENRYFNYALLNPSTEALRLAEICGKDPQFVELVLLESKSVIRVAPGTIIVEHKSGFISANAGIDHSNIGKHTEAGEKWALLIPEDADASAAHIRSRIKQKTGKNIAVLIIDSHGRPWRLGTVGISIGFSGLSSLIDKRGMKDLYGRTLEATIICAVDGLAAAASLVMGEADEGVPAVHVSGFPFPMAEGHFSDLIRPKESDFFR
jgi:coenzyme F420-0:L-glutamate ligase / coenzyme F420-1:gamma-L-glutamate ligase